MSSLSCLFILYSKIQAQESYAESKSTLILQLLEHVSWQENSLGNPIAIGFLGSNEPTYLLLEDRANRMTIKNRKFQVKKVGSLDQLADIDVLIVNDSISEDLRKVNPAVRGKQILLISEKSLETIYFMINLFYNPVSQSPSFIINRQNLVMEGFSIDNDIFSLGGYEMDANNIYRSLAERLEEEKLQSTARKRVIEAQNLEIDSKKVEMEEQSKKSNQLAREILDLQSDLYYEKEQLREIKERTELQRQMLADQNGQISSHTKRLKEQNDSLISFKTHIDRSSNELDSLAIERSRQDSIMTNQLKILNANQRLITVQNKIILIVGCFLAVVMILIFILFKALKKKRLLTIELEASNIQLKEVVQKLNFANRELSTQKQDLKHAIQDLHNMQEQLLRSEKMAALGVITAGVAHEINNPLNFVKSGLIILSKELLKINSSNNMKFNTTFSHMEMGIDRISSIVSSLNIFSSSKDQSVTACDLHKVISCCLMSIDNIDRDRVTIETDFCRTSLHVIFNEQKLHQIFINLLSNAVGAIDNTGIITIKTGIDEANKLAIVEIRDDGHGIEKKDLRKIFDPFFTTKEAGEGTGLGLYMVQNLMNEFKGSITISSKVNVGTTVKLSFEV